MNNGFSNISTPSLNGLIDIKADLITSSVSNTSQLFIDGVDITTQLNQVPINTANIAVLQQITTGQTYDSGTDTTTIDNNLIVSSGNTLKCNTTPTTDDDITNKLFVDTAIANIVNSAPATLDTLNELASALGNDANYATTVTNAIAGKVSLTTSETIYGAKTFNTATNFGGIISLNSATTQGNRQINNTFYNLFDNTAGVVSGTYRGRIYTTTGAVFLELNSATHTFSINNSTGGVAPFYNPFYINPTICTITTSTCPTIAGFTDPIPSNSSNNIASTRWVQSAITASPATLVNVSATIPAGVYNIPVVSGTGNQQLKSDLILQYDTTGVSPSITANLNGTANATNLINTSTLPATGTFYLPYITATGASTNQIVYANSNISYDRTNNKLIVPNVETFGGFSSQGNNNFLINTNATSTGSFIVQTQSIPRLTISSSNCTITTTNCPTITGFTLPPTSDTTSKIATTQWVQSVIPSLTNVLTTNTAQTITANKTFTGNIILSDGGTNNSIIDQYANQFNLYNNVVNNTTATITGLIPSVNLNCIVRTDAVGVVAGVASVSGPNITGLYNEYNNFFCITGTTTSIPDITVQALNQIQSAGAIAIGSYITTFIGTRFVLGTYITADLGLGVYTISPNALVATAVKATTGVSYTSLNRPFVSGGAVNGTINLDYNTTTNIKCLNQSSLMLDAISVKPSLTTSTITMYGDTTYQGQINFYYGGLISASKTLSSPLAQLYVINASTASTVTLPNVSMALSGVRVMFKRSAFTQVITFNTAAGTAVFLAFNNIVGAISVSMTAAQYQCEFFCVGTAWLQMNMT